MTIIGRLYIEDVYQSLIGMQKGLNAVWKALTVQKRLYSPPVLRRLGRGWEEYDKP